MVHTIAAFFDGYQNIDLVPTELTEYTEAYGLIFLESTERIDATRHTTEGTELIACVA